MTGLGHLDQFPPTSLSVGYRIGQRTFAAPSPIGCRAPKPAIPGVAIELPISTLSGTPARLTFPAGRLSAARRTAGGYQSA